MRVTRLGAGERMVGAHDRAERGAQTRGNVILAMPLVDEDQGDVGPRGAHLLDMFGGVGVDDPKGNIGMARRDRLDRPRNDADEQRRNGGDPHLAANVAGNRGDLRARARHSASVLRVWRSNCSPAGVSRTPLPRRSKIGTPISASSLRIWRLTAEEATLSFSAARRIDPTRATWSR